MSDDQPERTDQPLPLTRGMGWRIWQRGQQVLRLVSEGFPADVFLLMLPECVLDSKSGYFFWCADLAASATWHAHGASAAVRVAVLPDAAEYQTCLTCHPGVVTLSLSIRNLSPERWRQASGVVCLRLAEAPTFADEDLARTYMRSGNQFVPLAETDRSRGNPLFNSYLSAGVEAPAAWSEPGALWTAREEVPDDGFIATVARDGSGVVALLWEPSHDIGCNSSEHFRCIHSNPLIGDLGAGETATCRGCICVLRGIDLEESYQRCRSAIAEAECR
jgi:hypothetical protein